MAPALFLTISGAVTLFCLIVLILMCREHRPMSRRQERARQERPQEPHQDFGTSPVPGGRPHGTPPHATAQQAPVEGIDILAVAHDTAGASCPVCGAGLEGATVACEICRVPYHADCFKYAGRCAVYGCRHEESTPLRREPCSGTVC